MSSHFIFTCNNWGPHEHRVVWRTENFIVKKSLNEEAIELITALNDGMILGTSLAVANN